MSLRLLKIYRPKNLLVLNLFEGSRVKPGYPCSATLTKILPDPLDGMMPELAIVAAAHYSFLGTSSRLDKDKSFFNIFIA